VDYVEDVFCWIHTNAAPRSRDELRETQRLSTVPEPFLREICPGYFTWTQQLASRLERGWTVVLDYGLTESELALPHRSAGTLTGYHNHQRSASVLEALGEQDITHQVNFTAVCEAALDAQLTIVSYLTQAQFLTPLGMLHFSDTATPLHRERTRETGAFRTLTHPETMGHRFKALLLSTPCCGDIPLTGTRFGGRHGIIPLNSGGERTP
jgi:SAM-dependent MidA family methyltransferase